MSKNPINYPYQITDLDIYKLIFSSSPSGNDLESINENTDLDFLEKKTNEKTNLEENN